MATLKTPIPDGLLIPERCQASALTAVGVANTSSTYTEATPRPGLAISADAYSQLTVEVRHQQGVDLDVLTVKAGSPARDGVQLAYKPDTSSEYLTWDGPGVCNNFIPLDWGNDNAEVHNIATVPSTQKVVVAVMRSDSSARLRVIDTDHSVTEQTASMAAGTDWNFPALVVLPGSERILCFHGGAAYYSDDLGATWGTHSVSITELSSTNYGPTTACEYRGDIVLFVEDTATAETIHHLVSTDGGATFNLVSTVASLGVRVTCTANADGIHVAWVDQGTASEYRKLGTAFETLDAVTQTAIGGSAGQECAIWADHAGTLYIMAGDYRGYIFASHDAGENWGVSYKSRGYQFLDTNDRPGKYKVAYALGQAFVVCGFYDGSSWATAKPGVMVLGGWSDLQITGVRDPLDPKERWGWSAVDGIANSAGQTYFPWATPDLQGWTETVAATNSAASSDTGGSLLLITSDGKQFYSKDLGTTPVAIVAEFHLLVSAGGSTSTQVVAATLRLADASAYEYECEVLFSTGAVYLNDVNGAGTSNASITLTGYYQFRVWLDLAAEEAHLHYRAPGSTGWSQLSEINVTDAGATANNCEIVFGHIATGSATSEWREVHYAVASANGPNLSTEIAARYSRSFNSRAEAIPGIGTTTGAAFLAATSGPARVGETFSVPAWHEHAIEQSHIELSPSRSATWRSTDLSEQLAVYDLGEGAWAGHGVALVVRGANFRNVYLESSTDGTSWASETRVDLATGFIDLRYTISGQTLYPDATNTTAADRWLWEQEKRGGIIICDDGGGTTATTRITSQTAGGWQTTAAGTTVTPIFRLEDVTDIGPLSGTLEAQICSPDGFAIKYQTAHKLRRYWRWRIPATTVGVGTPRGESYYEAAQISVCRVQSLGDLTTWGNADQAAPNVTRNVDSAGTARQVERGEEARRWSLGWASGPNNMRQLRASPDVDYVGPTTGLPLAGHEDVYHALRGIYRLTGGGSLPLCAVQQLPAADEVITDPTRFMVAHLTGPIRASHSGGQKMGTSEVVRTDSITLLEIV